MSADWVRLLPACRNLLKDNQGTLSFRSTTTDHAVHLCSGVVQVVEVLLEVVLVLGVLEFVVLVSSVLVGWFVGLGGKKNSKDLKNQNKNKTK